MLLLVSKQQKGITVIIAIFEIMLHSLGIRKLTVLGAVVETHGAWECLCGNSDVCKWCSLSEEEEWDAFHFDATQEYASEFDAIFNSLIVTSKRTPKGLRVTVKRENGKLARSYNVK